MTAAGCRYPNRTSNRLPPRFARTRSSDHANRVLQSDRASDRHSVLCVARRLLPSRPNAKRRCENESPTCCGWPRISRPERRIKRLSFDVLDDGFRFGISQVRPQYLKLCRFLSGGISVQPPARAVSASSTEAEVPVVLARRGLCFFMRTSCRIVTRERNERSRFV